MNAPTLLLFDVNETLLDMSSLASDFEEAFGTPLSRSLWFENILHRSLVLNQLGAYLPFAELSESSLELVGRVTETKPGIFAKRRILRRIKELPLHPDVAPSLMKLKNAGFRLATLSNSSQESVRKQLSRLGVESYFEASLSTDAVKRFKPAAETYHYAAQALGLPLSEICLVAAHSWDTAGARQAGARAVLVRRPGLSGDPLYDAAMSVKTEEIGNLLTLLDKITDLDVARPGQRRGHG